MRKVDFPVPLRRNDGTRPRILQILTQMIGVKGFIGQKGSEYEPVNQVRHSDNFAALARQQLKANEVTEYVGEGENLGCQPAL